MKDEVKQKIFRVVGTIVVLALIIGGVYYLAKRDTQNQSSSPSGSKTSLEQRVSPKDDDWIKGRKDAKVTIIDYSDFQCPACAYASTALNNIYNKYPDKVAIIYRHFPLDFHQFALEAATATEVAGEAGKFWEMHDQLFANQDKISSEEILNIAEKLGFVRTDFEKKLKESKYKDAVFKDQLEATDLKLDHTPTIFINGTEYVGNLDESSLEAEIKKYL